MLRCASGILHVVGRQKRSRDAYSIPGSHYCSGVMDPRMCYWRYDFTNALTSASEWDTYYHSASSTENLFHLTLSNSVYLLYDSAATICCWKLDPWEEELLTSGNFLFSSGVPTMDAAANGDTAILAGYHGAACRIHRRINGVLDAGVPIYTQGLHGADLCMEYGAMISVQTTPSGTKDMILLVNLDLDGDGLGDGWERRHFGDLQTADRHSNIDEDSMTDIEEYAAGTDPADAQNTLEMEGLLFHAETSAIEINWFGAMSRHYAVSTTTNMGATWSQDPSQSEAYGSGAILRAYLPASDTDQAWFKISVEPQP